MGGRIIYYMTFRQICGNSTCSQKTCQNSLLEQAFPQRLWEHQMVVFYWLFPKFVGTLGGGWMEGWMGGWVVGKCVSKENFKSKIWGVSRGSKKLRSKKISNGIILFYSKSVLLFKYTGLCSKCLFRFFSTGIKSK